MSSYGADHGEGKEEYFVSFHEILIISVDK